jgi:hypothetical protein
MHVTTGIAAQKNHFSRKPSPFAPSLSIILGITKLSQKEQPFQNEL